MLKVINFLDGKKTYIGIGAALAYSIAIFFGVPSNELVWGAIAAFTGISYRLAINKV